ncbi:MAG: hypothetical protein AB8G05_01555 [Oligoflexales bacterium]
MSKHETPLTRRYWREVKGTLIEEFIAVKSKKLHGKRIHGKRLIDGIIICGGKHKIATKSDVELEKNDIIVVQTKAKPLGMNLLGQALFSKHLMERFKPKSIHCVAICTKGDIILEELASRYDIEVVVYEN